MTILAADENPLIPATSEIILGLITFAIVVGVLVRYVFPRMEQTFQARRDAIEGGIKRAEQAQAEAQRLLEQYRAQLTEARTEAAQIRDGARAEGQRIVDEMRVQAQAESARIVQRGEEQLAAQRQQIVRELRGEIGSLAVQLAERVVGESLAEDERQRRTVDRFLDSLDGMQAPAMVGAPAVAPAEAAAPADTPSAGSGSPAAGTGSSASSSTGTSAGGPAVAGDGDGNGNGNGNGDGDQPGGAGRRPRRRG